MGAAVGGAGLYRTAQSLDKRYPPPFNWIERYAMHRAAGWICSGRLVAETLRAPALRPATHGADPARRGRGRFRPDPRAAGDPTALGWDEAGPPVVGYLGRFVPEKGLELLIRVLERLEGPWRCSSGRSEEAFLHDWARTAIASVSAPMSDTTACPST